MEIVKYPQGTEVKGLTSGMVTCGEDKYNKPSWINSSGNSLGPNMDLISSDKFPDKRHTGECTAYTQKKLDQLKIAMK